jgi:hypothetical protein
MIALIALLVVMFGILSFRIYRTIQYYNEAHNSADPREKSIARTNFIIHIVFCVLLSLIIAIAIYWFVF